MRWFLFLLSFCTFLLGGLILFASVATSSALHEIEGAVWMLTAAVLFSGASVVDAIVATKGGAR